MCHCSTMIELGGFEHKVPFQYLYNYNYWLWGEKREREAGTFCILEKLCVEENLNSWEVKLSFFFFLVLYV